MASRVRSMSLVTFRTIWPEYRTLTAKQLEMYYSDAVANGQIADEYLYAHDHEIMRQALSDAGLFTFGE